MRNCLSSVCLALVVFFPGLGSASRSSAATLAFSGLHPPQSPGTCLGDNQCGTAETCDRSACLPACDMTKADYCIQVCSGICRPKPTLPAVPRPSPLPPPSYSPPPPPNYPVGNCFSDSKCGGNGFCDRSTCLSACPPNWNGPCAQVCMGICRPRPALPQTFFSTCFSGYCLQNNRSLRWKAR